ncbi:hypothetical protein HH299_08025, partial [Xanthomonas sp. Kuri4-2]
EIAATLEEINAERRAVQQLMTDDAEQAVARAMLQAEGETPLAVCLERFLRQRALPAPAQVPLHLSYELSFGR